MKLVQYKEPIVSTVDTDGLVLKHQAISSYNAEYASNVFPAVYGFKFIPADNPETDATLLGRQQADQLSIAWYGLI